MVLEMAFALREFTLPPPDACDKEQGRAAVEGVLRMAPDLAGHECGVEVAGARKQQQSQSRAK